jgi:2-methylisocitrate lyase-like PEP mutase family enzyme
MTQTQKAEQFAALHIKGNPVTLYNIWDAGSALAVTQAGAKALATGSHSVAAAQGYDDGEAISLDELLTTTRQTVATSKLPLSVDFEGGFAVEPEAVANNVQRVIAAGAIGINFEDQIVGTNDLYPVDVQAKRIATIRDACDMPCFINARTDVFLREADKGKHAGLIEDVLERASAYADAGASGLFIPGTLDEGLIGEICERTLLPVNVLMRLGALSNDRLGRLGVARISYGPFPYIDAMKALTENAKAAMAI